VRRRRILINALSLTQGGGRSYVRNVLRELGQDARGFDFRVLAAYGQISPEEAAGIPVARVRLPANLTTRALFRVFYEEALLPLRAAPYDLLYCLADLSPWLCFTPTVVALRNLNIYDRRFYDTPRTRTLFRLTKLGLRRARRIVCPSLAAARLISPEVGVSQQRISIVPHGIATEAFAQGLEPIAHEAPYLFLPAALDRHKNIPVLIQSLLHVSDPRLQVWIAGGDDFDPEHGRQLRSIVESLRLQQRVRFLGAVPYREILRLYRGSEALVFPSLIETFGHPLLEAMLAGTPIIASDIPSFHEIAGDVALYFPPRDPKALARSIDALRREREQTRQRVERGRARAAEFSWKRSVDRLCKVFEEALAEA